MRPIHGAAPGISAADHFVAMRDNPRLSRPANPSEAVATADLARLMPPSRAHLRRLARHAAGLAAVEHVRPYPVNPHAAARDVQLAFYRQLVRELSGPTLTNAPVTPPRDPGSAETTLQRAAREHGERLAANAAIADRAAEHKRLAWRATATGQGEMFL